MPRKKSDNAAERRAQADRVIERAERRKQERRRADRRAPVKQTGSAKK